MQRRHRPGPHAQAPTAFTLRPQPIRVLDINVVEPAQEWVPTGILYPDGSPVMMFVGTEPIGFLHDAPRGRPEK